MNLIWKLETKSCMKWWDKRRNGIYQVIIQHLYPKDCKCI